MFMKGPWIFKGPFIFEGVSGLPATLAVVMIVKNEEEKLARCLDSVHPYVDEIIIVDTGSTDSTCAIASCFSKVNLFHYEWEGHFAKARNYGLAQSSCTWNLTLDADEHIILADWNELRQLLNTKDHFVGRIKIINEFINDQSEEEEASDWISRLIPEGIQYKGRIHEQVDTKHGRVKVPLVVRHDGYKAKNKSSRNIPLLLQELDTAPGDRYLCYQLGREYAGLKQYEQACNYYKSVYKDLTGEEGNAPNVVVHYIYALIGLGHLNTAAKIINESHHFVKQFPDYYFACGVFYLDYIMADSANRIGLLSKIEESYLQAISVGEFERYDSVNGTGSFAAYYNLGVYYETTGKLDLATEAYCKSAELGYKKADDRLKSI